MLISKCASEETGLGIISAEDSPVFRCYCSWSADVAKSQISRGVPRGERGVVRNQQKEDPMF